MSARAFGSGMISFGLVTIPVKLYSTGESSAGITFNMLHKKCGSRLRQQYFCPVDNEVVGREDIVKGYEYSKDQYVLFTESELKALIPEATNAVRPSARRPQSRPGAATSRATSSAAASEIGRASCRERV